MRVSSFTATSVLALAGALVAFDPVPSSDWLETKLEASAPPPNFGYEVAMDAETVVVFAFDDFPFEDEVGTVWIHSRADWSVAKLEKTEGTFGISLAIEGDFLAVGSVDGTEIYARTSGDGTWSMRCRAT